MIITGNVQVCADHLTLGRDMVVPSVVTADTLEPFRALASAIHGCDVNKACDNDGCRHPKPLAIMQLSHAGRQSVNLLGGRRPFAAPIAPSAVPLGRTPNSGVLSSLIHTLLFQTPRAMTAADIDRVAEAYIHGASLAYNAGFNGVELHASHGCG
jgi:2,4-dienoyl-CoA reductase-like NADH-dependent reductase (Old Yellow Enzyme family)